MKLLYTIVGMLVVLFVITFSLTNTVPVHLKYYEYIDVSVPSYLLIFISFGVGVLFAGFLDINARMRLVRKAGRLNKQIKKLEKKLKEAGIETEEKEVELLPPETEDATTV
jgi:uncharacterized integral membrane protein